MSLKEKILGIKIQKQNKISTIEDTIVFFDKLVDKFTDTQLKNFVLSCNKKYKKKPTEENYILKEYADKKAKERGV